MESSVVTERSNVTLDELPYDVIPELFRYVPTKELISAWRLVSTKWSHLASELCRQRSVRLRLPRHHEIVSSPIAHLFSDADNLPFSAAFLTLDSTMPEGHAFSNYATKLFGGHFKAARISTRLNYYDSFFETLHRMPKLVALEILTESAGYENTAEGIAFTYEKIELPALKALRMVYDDKGHFMRILEMCFRDVVPHLDFFDLRLNTISSIGHAEFARCAELVCSRNFPELTLDLPLKPEYSVGWRTLVDRGAFDIQTLEVRSYEEAELLNMTFDLLGPLLANCRGLTSLSLEGFEKRSLTSKPCRVPVMPTLKKLKLSEKFSVPDGRPIGQLQFEPFKARSFPNLTEVVVDCYAYYAANRYRSVIDLRQIFDVSDGADRFLGVTSLDIGYTQITTNWADVFPNVKTLSATPSIAEPLAPIFTNMTQVTELDLELNNLFPGLLTHISSLKKLKTLTVRLRKLEDEIGMFATLSPLNLIIVHDDDEHEVSDHCLSLLRSRHLSVELRKEDWKF